jgi:SAM-dependent methyltransferase
MTTPGEFWDQRFREHGWPTEPDPLLVEQASPLPAGRALDVGSGPGRNSLWLAGRGWSVTAVDASAVALDQAEARAQEAGLSLTTLLADVRSWTPPVASYELVVLANLHFPAAELASLMQRLSDALVPGGHLFVVGHDLANLGKHGPSDPELLLTIDRVIAALPPEVEVERVDRVDRPRDDVATDARGDVAVVAWARRRE